MNLSNIIDEIEKIDPEVYERLDGRRAAMKKFMSFSGKVAMSTVPIALGTMLNKSYGQSVSQQILDVLNFALTLEYLESEFYVTGLQSGIIAGEDVPAFQTISAHEMEHVEFLRSTIISLGGTPVPKPQFDYSAGNTASAGNNSMTGPFKDVFINYDLYLAVSQTFEDTGVRAYKGQAANLISSNEILTAALRIHSVEARHASHVREIRSRKPSGFVVGVPDPWITLNMSNIASDLVQPSYDGEQLTVQAGVNIVGINGFNITPEDASEAFDEPLSRAQILAIVDPFIVG